MATRDRILSVLHREAPSGFCDDCLATMIRANTRQQVHASATRLSRTPEIERQVSICNRCGKGTKLVTRYVMSPLEKPFETTPIDPQDNWLFRGGRESHLSKWLSTRPFEDGFVLAIRSALRCFWSPASYGFHVPQASLLAFCIACLAIERTSRPRQIGLPYDIMTWLDAQVRQNFPQHRTNSFVTLYKELYVSMMTLPADNRFDPDVLIKIVNVSQQIIEDSRGASKNQPTLWVRNDPEAWVAISEDIELLDVIGSDELMETPLFGGRVAASLIDDANFGVWGMKSAELNLMSSWYLDIIDGKMPSKSFLQEVAAMSIEDWEQGYSHIEELLLNITAGKRLREATPLAEKVVIDDMTGKLKIEPIPMLPADLYDTGLKKLRDQIDYMRSDRNNNFIHAMRPVLDKLDDALQRYADNPQRMHDDQLSASKQIKKLMSDGFLPDDHRIVDFSDMLDLNALDIRASIPEVAIAVRKRSDVRFQELDQDSRNKVQEAIRAVVTHSDKKLAEELTKDDEETFRSDRDPSNVESAYRLTSRLAKVEEILRSLGKVSATVGSAATIISVMLEELSVVFEIAGLLLRLLGLV